MKNRQATLHPASFKISAFWVWVIVLDNWSSVDGHAIVQTSTCKAPVKNVVDAACYRPTFSYVRLGGVFVNKHHVARLWSRDISIPKTANDKRHGVHTSHVSDWHGKHVVVHGSVVKLLELELFSFVENAFVLKQTGVVVKVRSRAW